jgi:hypothetical protein
LFSFLNDEALWKGAVCHPGTLRNKQNGGYMRNKKRLKHHKPNHNGKNRTTGKRVFIPKALEPGDGYRTTKPNCETAPVKEPKRELSKEEKERKAELKKGRAERAKHAQENWRAERQAQHDHTCCKDDEARTRKNAWLLKQLGAIRCDTVLQEGTGIMIGKVIPRSFERRPDVRAHMRHFAKVAEEAGYKRHWR